MEIGAGAVLPTPGSVLFDTYEIIEELGRGGMGAVYKARTSAGIVAIKALYPEVLGSSPEAAAAQFREEARILSHLRHAGLPAVTESFFEDGLYYFVMDFVSGRSLESELRGGLPPVERVMGWAQELLGILDYLHRRVPPVIVRDLKPSNVMLSEEGRLFLIDFGIAQRTLETLPSGDGMGTPGFCPLEQYASMGDLDARTDLYGMGATFYYLLTGRVPVEASLRVGGETCPPPSEWRAEVPRHVDDVVMRALAVYREDRFASAADMLADLQGRSPDRPAPRPVLRFVPPWQKGPVAPEADGTDIGRGAGCLCPRCLYPQPRRPRCSRCRHDLQPAASPPGTVRVTAGPFWMGCEDWDAEEAEQPWHILELPEFHIEVHPVTVLQFRAFMKQTGYRSTGPWEKYAREAGDDHPVRGVSWDDAQAYAWWLGRSLPTEAEWEKAARGPDGLRYPWGNEMPTHRPDAYLHATPGAFKTSAVGKHPRGRSLYGCEDLLGNVWEWTADWLHPYPYEGPYAAGTAKAIRGGAWLYALTPYRSSRRLGLSPHEEPPCFVGFRCVAD